MDVDGGNRKKLMDHAREPFWSPDSQVIGFLPQEYPKFNVIDYYTTGMSFYDLRTGKIEPHPDSANLHHLFNPCFAPNGKWVVATVHAGMHGCHHPFAIRGKTRVVKVMQIRAVRMRLDFARAQVVEAHPRGVIIDHIKPGIFLGQKTYHLAVRTPKGFARAVHKFFPISAVNVHHIETADGVPPFPF